jgi:chitinase
LRELKEKYPHLQTLISVGGWTWSENFSSAASSEASRQKLVKSCIDLYLREYPGVFDGIDVDWEFPVGGGLQPGRPEDKANYTLLLKEFRRQLDELGSADGRHYLLTIALSPGSHSAESERDEIAGSGLAQPDDVRRLRHLEVGLHARFRHGGDQAQAGCPRSD